MGLRFTALIWGLAEATLFFIVPDVILSAVALRDRALALRLCLWALAGALVGGAVMYFWGSHSGEQVRDVLVRIPAIGETMLATVADSLEASGVLATFLGPLTGTPYKIYAALAPEADIALATFLAISIPARLIRFVLVALVTAWIARRWFSHWTPRARLLLLLSLWTIFYIAYFLVFGF
ncbi:MAG: hypothetical protein EA370_04895, partial [Wenzhouxiangella sp.]